MPCYFLDGVAKHVDMIDAQACDPCNSRGDDDVGGIIFPTDTAFNDCRVNPLTHVRVECHKGQETEVDGLRGGISWQALYPGRLFQAIPCFKEVLCKVSLRQGFIIDLDALAYKAKMWRSVETNFAETGFWLRRRR